MIIWSRPNEPRQSCEPLVAGEFLQSCLIACLACHCVRPTTAPTGSRSRSHPHSSTGIGLPSRVQKGSTHGHCHQRRRLSSVSSAGTRFSTLRGWEDSISVRQSLIEYRGHSAVLSCALASHSF